MWLSAHLLFPFDISRHLCSAAHLGSRWFKFCNISSLCMTFTTIDLKFSKLPFLKKLCLHYMYYLFLVWAIYYGFVWSIWNRCAGDLSSYICACRESRWNQWNIWWNILFEGKDLLIQQQCGVIPSPHSDAFLHFSNRADQDQTALVKAVWSGCTLLAYKIRLDMILH